jgi:2-polyprenyl-3-methyl-5-hydroxy-6-metoxy-1,4-benzoquinol methylase
MTITTSVDLDTRARQSLGSSSNAIYQMLARGLAAHGVPGGSAGRLIDVGCGGGGLWREVQSRFAHYCGLDAVRYDGFPADGEFRQIDLDSDRWPDVATGDVVAAVETIEHLENPWGFMRRLSALAKPGALVVVTTPNQLSVLSLITLATKRRFSAFQDSHYPAHRTALLESDLCRAAREAGLEVVAIAYSLHGRLPLAPWHYPTAVARLAPRALSDNLMVVARKRDG